MGSLGRSRYPTRLDLRGGEPPYKDDMKEKEKMKPLSSPRRDEGANGNESQKK